jgi:exodeoxyribonuclease VII large subunit
LQRQRGRLRGASNALQALSPLSVLARGYALVYNADGILLRSADETAAGQNIRARLSRGSLEARVIDTRLTDTKPTENSNS